MSKAIRAVIAACGSYLPEKILTNADLEKIVDTTDEWIVQRSGIRARHIAAEGETTADMAIAAGRDTLASGKIDPATIDGVIVATSTPDQTFPSVAVKVQAALSIPPGMAFDVQAVCSGFVYGLSLANAMITTGQAKRILVVGAEKMSAVMDWTDRSTCVLFGDGAGAVVLEADETAAGASTDRGILSTHLYADGRLKDILYTTGGTSSTRDAGYVFMEGKEVFRHAVAFMAEVAAEVLSHNGEIKPEDIDWLVPHQANIRIIEATAKKLNLPMDKVILTLGQHGNTSAASIPLALCHAVREGKIKRGDLLLMEALGAGLTWGAVLIRF